MRTDESLFRCGRSRYLSCGDARFGFAEVSCADCGASRVYDPWPVKSGNQINQSQADMLWHHGVKHAVR